MPLTIAQCQQRNAALKSELGGILPHLAPPYQLISARAPGVHRFVVSADQFPSALSDLVAPVNTMVEMYCGTQPLESMTAQVRIVVEPNPDYAVQLRVDFPRYIVENASALQFLGRCADKSIDRVVIREVLFTHVLAGRVRQRNEVAEDRDEVQKRVTFDTLSAAHARSLLREARRVARCQVVVIGSQSETYSAQVAQRMFGRDTPIPIVCGSRSVNLWYPEDVEDATVLFSPSRSENGEFRRSYAVIHELRSPALPAPSRVVLLSEPPPHGFIGPSDIIFCDIDLYHSIAQELPSGLTGVTAAPLRFLIPQLHLPSELLRSCVFNFSFLENCVRFLPDAVANGSAAEGWLSRLREGVSSGSADELAYPETLSNLQIENELLEGQLALVRQFAPPRSGWSIYLQGIRPGDQLSCPFDSIATVLAAAAGSVDTLLVVNGCDFRLPWPTPPTQVLVEPDPVAAVNLSDKHPAAIVYQQPVLPFLQGLEDQSFDAVVVRQGARPGAASCAEASLWLTEARRIARRTVILFCSSPAAAVSCEAWQPCQFPDDVVLVPEPEPPTLSMWRDFAVVIRSDHIREQTDRNVPRVILISEWNLTFRFAPSDIIICDFAVAGRHDLPGTVRVAEFILLSIPLLRSCLSLPSSLLRASIPNFAEVEHYLGYPKVYALGTDARVIVADIQHRLKLAQK
jgi:hypothetical protein